MNAPSPCTFLVGSERSGTTLFRLMLDQHPELAFHYEFDLAVDLVGDDGSWPPLDQYLAWLRTYRFVDGGYAIDPSLDYPGLVRSFLEQKRSRDGKRRIGATVHRNFHRLPYIWPDAKFIHLCRDGRDVARSCVAMGWYGNVWAATERWIEAEVLWQRLAAAIPPSRRMDVKYEDLVTDPTRVLTAVCEFMGLGFSEAMFDYVETSTYEYPDASLAAQWRSKAPPREVQLIEARIGDMLIERGYPLSGLPRRHIGALEAVRLRMHDRFARASARVTKYGPKLWLADLVARRVGPPRWRDSLVLKINAIENARIK